jgi:excisionase family DNA binding protein
MRGIPMTPENLISVKAAAKKIGVSQALVYQLCAEGTLPHYRVGGKGKRGKIVIDPNELENYFQGRRVEPAPGTQPPLGHIILS